MKKCFLLMLFIPCLVNAQKKYNVFNASVPKGTNTIIVKGVVFDTIVNRLLDLGFHIDKIDKDYKTLQTDYHNPLKEYFISISYDIRVKDSTAFIKGAFEAGHYNLIIENQKWGVYKSTFNIMNEFALSIGDSVRYAKQ